MKSGLMYTGHLLFTAHDFSGQCYSDIRTNCKTIGLSGRSGSAVQERLGGGTLGRVGALGCYTLQLAPTDSKATVNVLLQFVLYFQLAGI